MEPLLQHAFLYFDEAKIAIYLFSFIALMLLLDVSAFDYDTPFYL